LLVCDPAKSPSHHPSHRELRSVPVCGPRAGVEVDVAAMCRRMPERCVSVRVRAWGRRLYSPVRKLPYLGGFRNKKTRVEYLHAQVQTDVKPRGWKTDFKFTRETQTMDERSRTIQTKREASTQMQRPDLLLDESRDVQVGSGTYTTSEQHQALKEEKTLVLQRYARGWRARRLANEMREDRDAEWAAANEAGGPPVQLTGLDVRAWGSLRIRIFRFQGSGGFRF